MVQVFFTYGVDRRSVHGQTKPLRIQEEINGQQLRRWELLGLDHGKLPKMNALFMGAKHGINDTMLSYAYENMQGHLRRRLAGRRRRTMEGRERRQPVATACDLSGGEAGT